MKSKMAHCIKRLKRPEDYRHIVIKRLKGPADRAVDKDGDDYLQESSRKDGDPVVTEASEIELFQQPQSDLDP